MKIIETIYSSVWDLQCSLRNGYKGIEDLPVLERTAKFLESRPNSTTMLKMVKARIKKIKKNGI